MIRTWRRRHAALVCRDAVALMTAYVEGALADRDKARLEIHLADCPHCSEYLAQLRITIDALGHVDTAGLSDDALDDLVALYRRFQSSE